MGTLDDELVAVEQADTKRKETLSFGQLTLSSKVRSGLWSAFIVAGIVFTWSLSTVVLSNLTSEYENPWALTWLAIASGIFATPLYWLFTRKDLAASLFETTGLTVRKAFLYAIPLSLGLLLQAVLYNAALNLTVASTVVVLWNSSAVFVYVLSIWLLNEKVSLMKIASMSVCIAGVAIFSLLGENDNPKHDFTTSQMLLGYVLTLASGLVYALYSVLMKKVVGECDLTTGNIFMSLQGAAAFVYLPAFPIAVWAGWDFELPPTKHAWEMYSLAIILSCGMNYFFLLGIATINPLFISFASMLAIPATALISGDHFDASNVIGGIMVAAGFLGLGLDVRTLDDCWKPKDDRTEESRSLVDPSDETPCDLDAQSND